MKTIIVIGALLLLACPTFAGNKELDRKQIYELKEKCQKAAEAYFMELSANLPKGDRIIITAAHYNIRLNTCLYAESVESPTGIITSVTDILENRIIDFCTTKSRSLSNVEEEYRKCNTRLEQLMTE